MIKDVKFAQRWNQAGPECNADLLGSMFRKLESPEEVANHNLVFDLLLHRINESQLRRLLNSIAGLVEEYSREALQDGQKEG
jgi:hypothetical protein